MDMDYVWDKNRLDNELFASLKRSSPDPVGNADPEVSGQPVGEGDTSSEKAVIAESPGCRDDAESIIITSAVGSDSGLVSDTPLAAIKLMPEDTVGIVDSIHIELTTVQAETDEEVIQRLAGMTAFEYDRVRLEEAERLGVQLKTLDAEVKAARGEEESKVSPFTDCEPYAGKIDPAELFDNISQSLRMFLIVSEVQADAMTLWAAHTHMVDVRISRNVTADFAVS